MNTRHTPIPAGLPELQRGRHLDPATGGCFMEYASLLAGEPWSDRPRCTHPALAELARLVNDAVPQEARPSLARRIPDVVGVAGRDPALTPALVLLCGGHVAAAGREGVTWRWHARRAQRRLAATGSGPARWCRLTDRAYRAGGAQRAMSRTVAVLAAQGDGGERLLALLGDAIALCRSRLLPDAVGTDAVGAAAARPGART